MDGNAGYVAAAYIVVGAALGGYVASLVMRLRRAERASRGPDV